MRNGKACSPPFPGQWKTVWTYVSASYKTESRRVSVSDVMKGSQTRGAAKREVALECRREAGSVVLRYNDDNVG